MGSGTSKDPTSNPSKGHQSNVSHAAQNDEFSSPVTIGASETPLNRTHRSDPFPSRTSTIDSATEFTAASPPHPATYTSMECSTQLVGRNRGAGGGGVVSSMNERSTANHSSQRAEWSNVSPQHITPTTPTTTVTIEPSVFPTGPDDDPPPPSDDSQELILKSGRSTSRTSASSFPLPLLGDTTIMNPSSNSSTPLPPSGLASIYALAVTTPSSSATWTSDSLTNLSLEHMRRSATNCGGPSESSQQKPEFDVLSDGDDCKSDDTETNSSLERASHIFAAEKAFWEKSDNAPKRSPARRRIDPRRQPPAQQPKNPKRASFSTVTNRSQRQVERQLEGEHRWPFN